MAGTAELIICSIIPGSASIPLSYKRRLSMIVMILTDLFVIIFSLSVQEKKHAPD
jgi:hypothetical protein